MIGRATAGLILAGAIAMLAWRTRSLSRSGAAAATAVGTVSIAAGWAWGVLLIAFFITSSALSRFREEAKGRRTGAIVAKGGERDAAQVFANGGPFALAALLSILVPWSGWMPCGAGALAAAAADTWGTEIGMLAAMQPRLITTGRAVPVGTSGGVTPLGLAASVGGALCIAVVASFLGWGPRAGAAAVAGGIAGALADSLIGALWQSRRWCPRCGAPTEQITHQCGATTERAGGIAWLDNDVVNLSSGVIGAVVALAVALTVAG